MIWSYVFHCILFIGFTILVKLCFPLESLNPSGSFWHISDIHFDMNYSTKGDPQNMCHPIASSRPYNNGIFGDFLCDSPERLVNLTINEMKRIEPNPNFIIWTGDNLAHTRKPHPDWLAVFKTIKFVTTLLRKTFKENNVPIFPTIGNHDQYPPNILDPNTQKEEFYSNYLVQSAWDTILPPETWDTFKKGGFYSYNIDPTLRIISLNTILWYSTNKLVKSMTDPFDQLKWFEEELKNATLSHIKVYIIGHVSPGFYNRVIPGHLSIPTVHDQYLKSYIEIIKKYYDVIAGQFFGHVHTDYFQIQFCDTDKALSSALLASSISPWHLESKIDVTSLAVNPSVRLMKYDKMSLIPTDYDQYFLNLTLANEKQFAESETMYKLLYTFTKAYGVDDVSTKSLVEVYEKIKKNSDTFDVFYNYLTAAKKTVSCDPECVKAQLCSMSSISEKEYRTCMKKNDDDVNHSRPIVWTVCILAIFLLLGLCYFFIKRQKARRNDLSRSYILTHQ